MSANGRFHAKRTFGPGYWSLATGVAYAGRKHGSGRGAHSFLRLMVMYFSSSLS
jgi:hypothetical protein